jgi:beta-1,4-N-acetylglucosaminyltransferase
MSSKLCFLTVGATASFSALIEAAVSPAFLTALESQGYTELSVQYGQDGKQLFEKCKSIAQGSSKLKVTGFDLDKAGLGRHMRRAKGAKDAVEGVVISHAGIDKRPAFMQPHNIYLHALNEQAPAQSSTPSAPASPSSSSRTKPCSTTTKSSSPKRWQSKNTSCMVGSHNYHKRSWMQRS